MQTFPHAASNIDNSSNMSSSSNSGNSSNSSNMGNSSNHVRQLGDGWSLDGWDMDLDMDMDLSPSSTPPKVHSEAANQFVQQAAATQAAAKSANSLNNLSKIK
ncbi:hypothetical protein M5D96_013597 [Drosophila gunungcola]|uniref:Uncharacterized protein n=1 Tax=Drosophila gunungcola TaxID=103775 RepID=A0A9P9YB63_9MUSC|nr:hypothetical protein M5D96_013597 [Drosophila gunungcola]